MMILMLLYCCYFEDFLDFVVEFEWWGFFICIVELVLVVYEIIEVYCCVLCQNGLVFFFENLVIGEGCFLEILVFINFFGIWEWIELGFGLKFGNLGYLVLVFVKFCDLQFFRLFVDVFGYLF